MCHHPERTTVFSKIVAQTLLCLHLALWEFLLLSAHVQTPKNKKKFRNAQQHRPFRKVTVGKVEERRRNVKWNVLKRTCTVVLSEWYARSNPVCISLSIILPMLESLVCLLVLQQKCGDWRSEKVWEAPLWPSICEIRRIERPREAARIVRKRRESGTKSPFFVLCAKSLLLLLPLAENFPSPLSV